MVYRAADHKREMAKVADLGAQNLFQLRNRALEAISQAEDDEFEVGEDLTVTDKHSYTTRELNLCLAREAIAKEHQDAIMTWAKALAAEDAQVGAKLSAGAIALDAMLPQHWNNAGTDKTGEPHIQAVDNQIERDEDGAESSDPQTDSDPAGPLPSESEGFVIGPPTKPKLEWDEDFEYGSQSPTLKDWRDRAEWQAKLAGGRLLRPDLDDATAMYEHYWDNDGKPIVFDYEEAYREDTGVRANVNAEIARAQRAAEDLVRAGNTSFSMTGNASATKEYPVTENWQKAIGGYQQWSSADVRVDGNKVTMEVTVHAEDHYNFNRGETDIGTGTPDEVNGRFAEVGWAKPFDSSGSVTRTITWELGSAPSGEAGGPQFNPGREDRVDGRGSAGSFPDWPSNNRGTGRVGLP
ncbi:hypothetical protein [Mycobacterium hubeiense]|uniref:hypothetical protein n=1 Tax=Mycobacterium hubeiense TaxID=1867256 RepID=UPI0011571258|nr:hypothetical protein [Mycobacterium sp. QGD 101]